MILIALDLLHQSYIIKESNTRKVLVALKEETLERERSLLEANIFIILLLKHILLSFFTYPIYDIPDSSQATKVSLSKPVSVFVDESTYDEAAQTLLSKVLGSVGQAIKDVDIHKLPSGTDLRVKSSGEQHLIISFGFSPKAFSLQIDRTLYNLMALQEKTFLFSKPLSELPELPQDKRALWIALKEYFKIS